MWAEPSRDMSLDITYIGEKLRVLGQWRACRISSLHKHGICASFVHQCSRPSNARGARFLAYSVLNINFKGVFMKLKLVALAISEEQIIFTIFSDVLLLSYKPSNFVRAILPYASG